MLKRRLQKVQRKYAEQSLLIMMLRERAEQEAAYWRGRGMLRFALEAQTAWTRSRLRT